MREISRLIEDLNATVTTIFALDTVHTSGDINTYSNYEVCGRAVEALVEIGPPAVPSLIEALTEKHNYYGRDWAVKALSKIDTSSAILVLEGLLKSADNVVRYWVPYALCEIGAPAVPILCEALKDGNWALRWRVAEALGRIGDARAVPPLRERLKDENDLVRSHAERALDKIRART